MPGLRPRGRRFLLLSNSWGNAPSRELADVRFLGQGRIMPGQRGQATAAGRMPPVVRCWLRSSRAYNDRFKLRRGLVPAATRSGRVSLVSLALAVLGRGFGGAGSSENRRPHRPLVAYCMNIERGREQEPCSRVSPHVNAGRGKLLSYGYPAVRISARLLCRAFLLL
jgi:hypothetical protein